VTSEASARVRIDAMLKEAGFSPFSDGADNAPSVDYEGNVRNPIMAQRLLDANAIRPDYHLYAPNSDRPIAIIEAKKPGMNLDNALKQALEYAKVMCASENPSMLIFSSDGIQVKSMHGNGKSVLYNDTIVDYFPPYDLMRSLVQNPDFRHGEAIKNLEELLKLVERASNLMRSDGIDAGIDSLREFCMLLFIKIMSERGVPKAKEVWQSFTNSTGNEALQRYRDALASYAESYGDILSSSQIQKPSTFEKLVDYIDPINFSTSGLDIKGEAFEYFLKSYNAGNKSELGQYFTPRHITNMMANILNPQPGDKVLDPFCGTGGMLISCYRNIHRQIEAGDNLNRNLITLKQHTLYGVDISRGATSLARMNMILLGDGHSNIENTDSLSKISRHSYDKIITNIPFNLKGTLSDEAMARYYQLSGLNSLDMNRACVIKCIETLKPGGEMAIIVPLTLCQSEKYKDIRDYICSKGELVACIRLPKKTFNRYATAQAAILILRHAHRRTTSQFTFLQMDNDGMSQDAKREPVPENDVPELLEFGVANEWHLYSKSTVLDINQSCSFMDFAVNASTGSNYWRLGDLVEIVRSKTPIEPDKWYAEPALNSRNNSVTTKRNPRLGRNIKSRQKIVARKGDLIIGTLHTSQRNGLFAIADQEYIVTSQLVAKVRTDIVPLQYLIACMSRELPRQLIPTDLVDRETFSATQILNVTIPKPAERDLEQLRRLDSDYQGLIAEAETKKQDISKYLKA